MYTIDYGFASTPDYWTTNLFIYETVAKNTDWLFLGSTEWLLSPFSSISGYAWLVYRSGSVNGYGSVTNTNAVRPSFYLSSSVNYVSGGGTSSSPFRVN